LQKYIIYADNAAFQALEVLKTNRNKRHKRRAFFIEGVRNLNAAERYGWRFEALIYDGGAPLSGWARDIVRRNANADIYELAPALMKKLSAKTDTSELAAVIRMKDPDSGWADGEAVYENLVNREDANPIYALIDRPSSKGNLGTLMRSCDAFGVSALFRTGHSVDFFDPDVIAASMGSFFAVPLYSLSEAEETDNLIAALRRAHPELSVVGASEQAYQNAFETDLTKPLLFLFGNEADGLSWRLKQSADAIASIPMGRTTFASSLNVSCAATAFLYEAVRQRYNIKTKLDRRRAVNGAPGIPGFDSSGGSRK